MSIWPPAPGATICTTGPSTKNARAVVSTTDALPALSRQPLTLLARLLAASES